MQLTNYSLQLELRSDGDYKMKHLWIMHKSTMSSLFYHSFAKSSLDGVLVSGLLSAFSIFSEAELGTKGIESIEMSGLRWVYARYPDLDLLLIVAGDKNNNSAMLRVRMDVIQKMFVTQFDWIENKEKDGCVELSQFEPFHETLSTLSSQWEQADKLMDVGKLFDLLGVFQQIFIILIKIINDHVPKAKYAAVLTALKDISPSFITGETPQPSFRLIELFFPKVNMEKQEIAFDKSLGMNVVGLNPIGLDFENLKSMFMIVMINYAQTIRLAVSESSWLPVFNHELRPYIFSKWDFLANLKLIREMLEIFLE